MIYRLLGAALFGFGAFAVVDLVAFLLIEFIADRMENQLSWGHDLPSDELYRAVADYKSRNQKKWQTISLVVGVLAALYGLITGKFF